MSTIPYKSNLSEALLKKAKEELNENPEWRNRDIQALRDMIKANPALKCRTDDAFLLRFLRARKFDYERSYKLIIDYFTIRAENPSTLGNGIKPSAIRKVLEAKMTIPLPHRDKEGRKMVFMRTGNWNPQEISNYDMLRAELIMDEYLIQEEETQINGMVFLADMSGMTMEHAKTMMDITYMRLHSSILQDSFPARFKGMYAVYEASVFSYILSFIRPFLKEKMAKRINLFGNDLEKLHKVFDPEILPTELGGKLNADKIAEEWMETLLAKEAMYDEMAKNKIELLHQISSPKAKDMPQPAMTGTYKKLDVM